MKRLLFLLLAAGLLGVQANAATYYVSPAGNDSWSGLLSLPNSGATDGPFRTITKAQSAMQASGSNKTATIRAGTYSLGATLAFTSSDNNETWIAYPGETPVIDGGSSNVITISGVNTMLFQGLTFQNLGATGFTFQGAASFQFRWNHIINCNQWCMYGSSVTNSVFDSNTVNGQSPGNQGGGTSSAYMAIELSYGSTGNQLTHNLIENCQGGGLAFGAGPSDPANSNNTIDRNLLINVDNNVVDMGAIYFYDPGHSATGNKITNNFVFGNGNGSNTDSTKAIYVDDLASNMTIAGNICSRCGQFAFQIHGGDHNTIANNIFDLSSGSQLGLYQGSSFADDGMASNVIQHNIIYVSGTAPSSLWNVNVAGDDILPTTSSNMYYSASGASLPNTGVVDSSPVTSNPQFIQASLGNYSLSPSSPAFGSSFGFQPIPTDQGPLPYGGAPAVSGRNGLAPISLLASSLYNDLGYATMANSSGGPSAPKIWAGATTANGSGVWSVNIASAGFTQTPTCIVIPTASSFTLGNTYKAVVTAQSQTSCSGGTTASSTVNIIAIGQ